MQSLLITRLITYDTSGSEFITQLAPSRTFTGHKNYYLRTPDWENSCSQLHTFEMQKIF